MEKIIQKLTLLPAQIFRLPNKGMISPGFVADMLLFDADELSDQADFSQPHRLSKGIKKVWRAGLEKNV